MPKILVYITAKTTWIFIFYGTDFNENRAHIHVGKKDTDRYCKIWLEPELSLAKQGDLSDIQVSEAMKLAEKYKDKLIEQWRKFKNGEKIRMTIIKKQ